MKRNKKFIFILFLISFLGLILRLYKLGEVPVSLHWDEASWGYNAYSILRTGRDEYGQFLPFIFKAFGDYKNCLYVYLTTISIAIFGLSEFAVRFPAAFFGAISIFLFGLFVKEIFSKFQASETIGLLTALILTFSFWHYDYSHGAWEVNIMLTFLLLGLLFFLKSDNKKFRLLYASAFLLGLCFYVYTAAKLLIPLIILGLWLCFRRKFLKFPLKILLTAVLILMILVLPIAWANIFGKAANRMKVLSIFSRPRPREEAEMIAKEANLDSQGRQFAVFYGPFHYYLRGSLGRYLNHFSGRFLFFEGDWNNPRHGALFVGLLNFLDISFLPLGIFFLISRRVKNQGFIWYLLAISPLPAALTIDVVQSLRSYFMVLPLSIVAGFGVYFYLEFLKKIKQKAVSYGLAFITLFLYLFFFIYFWDQYFLHTPLRNSQYWQYGYKEAVQFIKDRVGDYDKVIFTQKYGQPYIYYLLYTKYDPAKYQAQAKLIEDPSGDVGRVEKIDNIKFRNLYWPKDRFIKNGLFIGTGDELPLKDIDPSQARVLKEIRFLNGSTAFRIVETI